MKKQLLKPGFEFIMALSITAILGLPPLVLAQDQKNIEIRIVNGDTTVNGKDIKQLPEKDRREALQEISNNAPQDFTISRMGDGNGDIVIRRENRRKGQARNVVIEKHILNGNHQPFIAGFDNNDSTRKTFNIRFHKANGADSSLAFSFRSDGDGPQEIRAERPIRIERNFRFEPAGGSFAFGRRNVQTFNFTNTDNEGISTHISFRVSDASKDNTHEPLANNRTRLMLNDLSLSPEFSTGKTAISFNLPTKANADVKITDSNGKIILADKASAGSFSKKVNMPLNGAYYLTVKQGSNTAVKRIVKED